MKCWTTARAEKEINSKEIRRFVVLMNYRALGFIKMCMFYCLHKCSVKMFDAYQNFLHTVFDTTWIFKFGYPRWCP